MLYTIGSLFILLGAFFVISGMVGLVRFPDTFTKLHAASVTEVIGIPLALIGLAMTQNTLFAAAKVLILIPIIWIVGPVASHALAKAAYKAREEENHPPYTTDEK